MWVMGFSQNPKLSFKKNVIKSLHFENSLNLLSKQIYIEVFELPSKIILPHKI